MAHLVLEPPPIFDTALTDVGVSLLFRKAAESTGGSLSEERLVTDCHVQMLQISCIRIFCAARNVVAQALCDSSVGALFRLAFVDVLDVAVAVDGADKIQGLETSWGT